MARPCHVVCQVERQRNPSLRGKALVVTHGDGPLVAISQEAEALGVTVNTPLAALPPSVQIHRICCEGKGLHISCSALAMPHLLLLE